MLRFENIRKRFGDVTALDAVSLEAGRGRTTVLIGPSGCGKSTLLRLVVGLELPDEGDIRLDGQRLAGAGIAAARRRTGYMIQEGGLFPHLSAERNIALMARYLQWDETRIRERIAELLALVQMPAELLDRFPVELSGGQRQRVALMRALMLDPDVLLLDEPLGALDPMIRFELQQELRRIFSGLGKTVLLVTHDLGEAGFLGDALVLMRDGSIVQQGSARDLLDSPADAFVEQFVNAQRAPFTAIAGPGT